MSVPEDLERPAKNLNHITLPEIRDFRQRYVIRDVSGMSSDAIEQPFQRYCDVIREERRLTIRTRLFVFLLVYPLIVGLWYVFIRDLHETFGWSSLAVFIVVLNWLPSFKLKRQKQLEAHRLKLIRHFESHGYRILHDFGLNAQIERM